MKKVNFSLLIFLIFASLFLSQKVLAIQQAYIEKIEYSIDDNTYGPYNAATGRGLIAWVIDYNNEAKYGKVYYAAPTATPDGGNGSSNFTYNGGNIAVVNTTQHSRLYTRYTVYNTGDDPIEGITASVKGDYYGTKTSILSWKKDGDISGTPLSSRYLQPDSGPYYEQYVTTILNFPNGYLWKPIMLGWDEGHLFENERLGQRAILRTIGTDFYPPGISCTVEPPPSSPSPSQYYPKSPEDIYIEHGGHYKSKCTLRNLSSINTSYTKVYLNYESRLSWLTYARYKEATYLHNFDSEIITLAPGESKTIYNEITVNDTSSEPGYRNVNFSHLAASYTFYSCKNASCSQQAPLNLNISPSFGRGPGKYLAVDDPGTFSKTYIGSNGNPTYKAYFNLWNPDTKYNEAVFGTDYDIDIQILEKGDTWRQDASNAIRHYIIPVLGLTQETGASPAFPGYFAANWSTQGREDSFPFVFEIPDVQTFSSSAEYKLYFTTIWKNHPRTSKNEPIDRINRSFAPGLDLQLGPVVLPPNQSTFSTTNSIWNFSSQTLNVKIKLEESISDPNFTFSLSSNLCSPPETATLCFTLNPGQIITFPIDFRYNGPKPLNDIFGNLTGAASFQVSGGSYLISDTDISSITIEKAGNPPTAHNLYVTPPNPGDYCGITAYPPVRLNWEFSGQSAYMIQVDDDEDFSSLEVETGKISRNSQSYVLQQVGERLSWGKTYYWRLKVWSGNNPSGWIYPPNPPGQTTPRPGAPFQTTHPWPDPDFSLSPEHPNAKEKIEFTDLSQFYDSSASWFWDFGDGQGSTEQNPTHSYSSSGDFSVTLTITDSDNYSCSETKGSNIRLPLPEWKEITPF
jgi:PKD repeat protein